MIKAANDKRKKNIPPIKMQMEGYASLDKVADAGGNSGRVYVPKSWNGKRVRIVLLEEEDKGPADEKTKRKRVKKGGKGG